jgi:hypothetical protein
MLGCFATKQERLMLDTRSYLNLQSCRKKEATYQTHISWQKGINDVSADLHLELGPPRVASLCRVSDHVTSPHIDPLWDWKVMLNF